MERTFHLLLYLIKASNYIDDIQMLRMLKVKETQTQHLVYPFHNSQYTLTVVQ